MQEKIKCISHDCPLKEYCQTYNNENLHLTKCKFFFINGNHIGCESFVSKR